MFKKKKIGIKMLLVILTVSIGTLLIIGASSYIAINSMTDRFQQTSISLGLTASDDSKEALQQQAEDYLTRIAGKQAEITNNQLVNFEGIVNAAAEYVRNLYLNPDDFNGEEPPLPDQTTDGVAAAKYMLAPGVSKTEEIQKEVELLSCCEYMFAADLHNNTVLSNMYVGTPTGISYRYSRSNLYDPNYDPREREWYQMAAEADGKAVWMDTYTDSYGHVGITCARAVFDTDGNVLAVVGADITLQDLLDDIIAGTIGQTGQMFVLDADLNYIAHPGFLEEDFNTAFTEHVDDGAEEEINKISREKQGIAELSVDGKENYIAFSTLEKTGWKLCISIDQEEVIAPALQSKQEIDDITAKAQDEVQNAQSKVTLRFIILFAGVGIFVVVIAYILSESITRPILKLTKGVKKIGEGNFEQHVPVETQDEIGELAQSFNIMIDDLKSYVQQVTDVTAERERIGTELNVATRIQAGMLPSIFPAFPENNEFDIFASMNPAKEVGGDFYDFFLIDNEHLALVMADVSGKGVPAALFMVISKILLKNAAQTGMQPNDVLKTINNRLCENNNEGMFVTVWLGIYDFKTGLLQYANGGHECPAVMRSGGTYELIREPHDFVLGGIEDMDYHQYEIQLDLGDKLFLYTDGVTEATNADEKLFGEERMLEALNQCTGKNVRETLEFVKTQVDGFVGEAPQFDDLTMLCLEIKKKKN